MAHPDAPQKSFCTTREAADILGVTVRTVQSWVETGLLDAWKTTGGHRRVLRNSVQHLLASSPSQAESEPRADSALRILVVEDDPALRRLCERRMARRAMQPQVFMARNGFEGLVLLGLRMPDLLITDLHMPDMDGFQMLQHLRGMPELAKISIVVVTGLNDAGIRAGGVPAGIPVMPKPIPFDRLHDIAIVLAEQ